MAMVEMVFVLPVLLLVLFSIAEFGLMFSRWLTLSNAVREGARTGVTYRFPCDPTTVTSDAKKAVMDYAAGGGLNLAVSDINVTGQCVTTGTRSLKVDASYDFNLNIPFFSTTSIPLKYSSTMRNE